jgi:hypothetical protein
MFNLLKTYQEDLTYDNQIGQVIDLIRSWKKQ